MIEITKAMAADLGKGNFALFCDEGEVSEFATVAELGYPTHLEIKRIVNPTCKFCFKQRICSQSYKVVTSYKVVVPIGTLTVR
jgi:hypothetical protein